MLLLCGTGYEKPVQTTSSVTRKQMYTVLPGDAVRGATALPFTRWKQSSWTTTGSWAESWRHLRRSYSEFSRVSAVTCSNQRMFCRVDDIWFEFEYLKRKHVEAGWKHRILINAWPFSDAADINRYFAFFKTFFFLFLKSLKWTNLGGQRVRLESKKNNTFIFYLYFYLRRAAWKWRDAILAEPSDTIRRAYHGVWSTHMHTQAAAAVVMPGPKSHHLGEKTGQNLITASWNEITTLALLLYRSQYIIHSSLPPSPTNCIKPQICPL